MAQSVKKTTVAKDKGTKRAKNVGGWGGKCTCPNGKVYWVGDNNNWCKSLACFGGKSGKCMRKMGKWSNVSVKCAPAKKVVKVKVVKKIVKKKVPKAVKKALKKAAKKAKKAKKVAKKVLKKAKKAKKVAK